MIKSTALEVNLATTRVDVDIDPKYSCLQEVMSGYYGLLSGLETFLKEVSHPFKNWRVIVEGARGYALGYFHMMKQHPRGPEAAARLMDLFALALTDTADPQIKIDAADNLIVFLQKIVKTAEDKIPEFIPLVNSRLDWINKQPDKTFSLFVRSYYSVKRLAADTVELHAETITNFKALNRFLIRSLKYSHIYWLEQTDPLLWFVAEASIEEIPPGMQHIFSSVVHKTLREQYKQTKEIEEKKKSESIDTVRCLLELTHHDDMVEHYRHLPQKLLEIGGENALGHQWKILFLFHLMHLDALSIIHEDTLRRINRAMQWLIANQAPRQVGALVHRTFSFLKRRVSKYPCTALMCVHTMGQGIYKTNNGPLIDKFINAVINIEFQAPMITGIGNDWQIKLNNAHIHNIRTWMKLIELGPKRSTRLLSNLIIHLSVSGVFIRDTDLFGRDITRFLNGDIAPVYNLTKQLARLLPVYFNDIGAEGQLREISTGIDEICYRRDVLIHFLRKQSHVEGSNRVLHFMEAVLHFWSTKDKNRLAPFLPPDIYEQVEQHGPFIDGVHNVIHSLHNNGMNLPQDLLNLPEKELENCIEQAKAGDETDRRRVALFAEFYKQLNIKYNLNFLNLRHYIENLSPDSFPELDRLIQILDETDSNTKLHKLLDYLELLKAIILSDHTYEIREDIYKKRHFTVDIPSMYGSYQELKFDAMGLTLRLEALVNVMLEDLVNSIDLSLITKATCNQIYNHLAIFNKALQIDGINSAEMQLQLDMLSISLEIRGFSFTQYLDIFKGFSQSVKNIITDFFSNIHGDHLTRILAQLPADRISEKFHPANGPIETEKLRHRTLEIFFRDRLATALGLQQLDLYLSRIQNTLYNQSSKLPKQKLLLLLNYDPQRAIMSLQKPNTLTGGIIYLGNKGLNMLKLKELNMSIPPAFIITTEVFRCREIIDSFPPANENFREKLEQHIKELEQITGKRFGDPGNPLIFSVRSGSSISQPGMMDSFLNVGMNESIAQGLAGKSANTWFAWDNYRRFLQCYGMSLDLKRDDFDAIIGDFKQKLGIPLKRGFSGDQMKQVALTYKKRIQDDGHQIPSDPRQQLYQTINSVMNSWHSSKAKTYRTIMGISDDWGTAVTIQVMVFGNLSQLSGSGVIFTHNPRWSGESLSLWGDFTLGNQGEDVVAGLVQTLPISIKQQEIETRETDITLETHFPNIYHALLEFAQTLVYHKGWSPQELEFTFESPRVNDLYLLQTRDMSIRESKRVLAFDPVQKKQANYLGHGIGVSGGAMSGRLVFGLDEVDYWRTQEPKIPLILVRGDTVPDDIKEIFATDGLLTARGGVTSHASVVAHQLGKTCVVGCANLICDEANRTVVFANKRLSSGHYISIDGREGSVYEGQLKIEEAI
ncbi:MAG: pyruvate, phosphate dikinase [Desulfobacteraceae bacterium]|nr:pyruvate, phosphate dikinase [Desulfobacteraceae bacterium]